MFRPTKSQLTFRSCIAALPVLVVLSSQPCLAQLPHAHMAPADQIVAQLEANGYVIILVERTWLGRGRVVAEKLGVQRELVFNPGTGEIFRDYAMRFPPQKDESENVIASDESRATEIVATPLADEQSGAPPDPSIVLSPPPLAIDLGMSVDISIGETD